VTVQINQGEMTVTMTDFGKLELALSSSVVSLQNFAVHLNI